MSIFRKIPRLPAVATHLLKILLLDKYPNKFKYVYRTLFVRNIEFEQRFLRKAKGVLHIGAHKGQEQYDLPTLYIEANPDTFAVLEKKLKNHQKAICALLGDENKTVNFYVSSNDGESSSVFNFGESVEKGNFGDLQMNHKKTLEMKRLDDLISEENIKLYDYWVIDVQGAELLVLQGAQRNLKYCNYLKIEVSAGIEVYKGGVSWTVLKNHLEEKGLFPLHGPRSPHADVFFSRNSL